MNIYKIADELTNDDVTGLIVNQSHYDLDAGDIHDMELDLSKRSGLPVKIRSIINNGRAIVNLQIGKEITSREGNIDEITKFIEDLFDEATRRHY